jgi:hypothetical protein
VLRQGAGRLRARRRLAARRCLRLKASSKAATVGSVSSREAATLAKLEAYPASSTLAKVEAHVTYLTSSVLLFTIAVLMVSFAVTYVKGFVFGIFWSRSPLPTSRVSSLGSSGLVRRYLR